ncbi:ATPase involved in DNA repair, SbcC [Candidatus Nanobsidianus stetteri]|uniref:ATPase involved in DNA repair, SbcC n=1 Tax=Nanobsidianus stetteri TaxID=1294122 RepID=R1GA60_NANST|nr:ATPase involved in DNA repair, SbcC [Candidatus Nanobsidianus stetteri]
MKINRIRLENFKIHKNLEVNFDEKNIIIGENGVGKTSIFQAILFGLFGKDSLSNLNISNVSSLIRIGSHNLNVELEISDGNTLYKIIRSSNNNGESKAILYKENSVIASGPDIVNKKIREILNINRVEKFTDVLYIKQGDLGRYINLSGKIELTKLLEKIFDIEYYSLILKVVEGLIKDLEKEKEYKEKEKSLLLKDIELYKNIFGDKDIERLLEEINKYLELKKIRDNIYKDYLELKTLESSIDYNLLTQENYLNQKLKEYEEKEKELYDNILNLESERKNLKYENYSKDLLNSSLEYLESRKKELEYLENVDEKELEYKLKELREIYSNIEKYIEYRNIEVEIKNIDNKKKELENNIIILENKIKEEEAYLNILNREISECPVCKRALDEDLHKKLLNQYRESLNKDKENLNKFKNEKNNLDKLYQELENKYKYFLYIQGKIKDRVNLSDIENEKIRIEKEINDVNYRINQINEYKMIKDTINYIKKNELDKVIDNLRKEYQNIKNEINNIKYSLMKIENMKKNLEKIKDIYKRNNLNSLSEFENKLNELDKEIKKYENLKPELIKNYKEKLNMYNNINEKLKNISKNINILRSLYNVLLKYIEVNREKISKNLENAFKFYFKKLYRYQDITDVGIDIKESKVKDEKLFYIYVVKNIDGKTIKKYIDEAGLSGGQIKILDLALRLAIASILNLNINVLLLDEPTESLDVNVRLSLAQLISSLDNYQVILCTHDDLFKDNVEGKIIEIKR